MSRWTHGKPAEREVMPFSRNDGHRVGDGRKATKTLTAAVKRAEAARDYVRADREEVRAELAEMRELARSARDMQADIRARVRRAVWTVAVCAAATVGSFLYALARIGAL